MLVKTGILEVDAGVGFSATFTTEVVIALAGGEGVGILGVGIFEGKEVDLVIDAKAAGGEIGEVASNEKLLLPPTLIVGEADLSFFDGGVVEEEEPFK